MSTTIAALFADARRASSDRPAITTPRGETLSHADLEARALRACGWLAARGVSRGDRVVVRLPKGQTFVDLYLACLASGAVFVPVNDAATAGELEHFVADADPRLLVVADDASAACPVARVDPDDEPFGEDEALDAPPPAPDDVAVLLYTSGTTGKPKGAMLTQANLAANAAALAQAWGWRGDDVLVHALPLFHVHGLFVALGGALAAGAHAVLLPRFAPDAVCDAIAAHRATVFMAVPTMHHRLVADAPRDADLSSLRLVTSGSAPLRPELAEAARALFGRELVERYGMTEVGIAASQPRTGARRYGTVGVALPSVSLRVVDPESLAPRAPGDVGEVQIAGPSVFAGYWRRPEQTTETFTPDGWLRSGDLGTLDADGTLSIVGRRKELIISAGFNVYPREVEECLASHPAVREAAVVGVPDDDRGELVAAALVLTTPGALPQDELLAHCREHLAPYKSPWLWLALDDLPRNAMGKVQKHALVERFTSERRA